jgi:hypothetical protein
MSHDDPIRRGWRLAAAVTVVAWLVPAVWLLVRVLRGDERFRAARPDAMHSPFTALAELLLPALLLAALALALLLLRRPATAGWTIVFLFALLGFPAWLFLRGPAYRASGWVTRDVVTTIVWMVLGLAIYLVALSLLMVRGKPAPRDVHVSQQFIGAPGVLHTNTPTGSDPLVEREAPDSTAP